MNNLYIDVARQSLNKRGETLCGDNVQIIRGEDGGMVMVLADGLGSGVKANILSTLTGKIISTMLSRQMSLEQAVAAIAKTLPVCSERQVAYSTFTIIKVEEDMSCRVIDYDNPNTIMIRDGQIYDYPKSQKNIEGKDIFQSKIRLKENDTFISISDGVLYASDNEFFDMKNWRAEHVADYCQRLYEPQITANAMCMGLLDKVNSLYGGVPKDDTTVCTVKVRKRATVNVMVGPPTSREDDGIMLPLFFSKKGEKVVSGGTTAKLVSRYLGKNIVPLAPVGIQDVPPMSAIEGVDLVTEGVVTLNKVLEYAQQRLENPRPLPEYACKQDGAALLAQKLIDTATDVNFFLGRAVNEAHLYDVEFVKIGMKKNLVSRLEEILKKMNKTVKVYEF